MLEQNFPTRFPTHVHPSECFQWLNRSQAHSRQDRRFEEEGDVDGRRAAAWSSLDYDLLYRMILDT